MSDDDSSPSPANLVRYVNSRFGIVYAVKIYVDFRRKKLLILFKSL